MPPAKRSHWVRKDSKEKLQYIKIKDSVCNFIKDMWKYYDGKYGKMELNEELILNDNVMVKCLEYLKFYAFEYNDIFTKKGDIPSRSWKVYKTKDVKHDWKCIMVTVDEIIKSLKKDNVKEKESEEANNEYVTKQKTKMNMKQSDGKGSDKIAKEEAPVHNANEKERGISENIADWKCIGVTVDKIVSSLNKKDSNDKADNKDIEKQREDMGAAQSNEKGSDKCIDEPMQEIKNSFNNKQNAKEKKDFNEEASKKDADEEAKVEDKPHSKQSNEQKKQKEVKRPLNKKDFKAEIHKINMKTKRSDKKKSDKNIVKEKTAEHNQKQEDKPILKSKKKETNNYKGIKKKYCKENKKKSKNKKKKQGKPRRRSSGNGSNDFWQSQTAHWLIFSAIVIVPVVLMRMWMMSSNRE